MTLIYPYEFKMDYSTPLMSLLNTTTNMSLNNIEKTLGAHRMDHGRTMLENSTGLALHQHNHVGHIGWSWQARGPHRSERKAPMKIMRVHRPHNTEGSDSSSLSSDHG